MMKGISTRMTPHMMRFTGWNTVSVMGAWYITPPKSLPATRSSGIEPDRPACQMTKPE